MTSQPGSNVQQPQERVASSPCEDDRPTQESEERSAERREEHELAIQEFVRELSKPGTLRKLALLQEALEWKWGDEWLAQVMLQIEDESN
ncbi:MAG: hypothetical protein Q8P67_27645 [archaeon]|nr:hypothetical protein [archaeon]